jgi:hypothetical protein
VPQKKNVVWKHRDGRTRLVSSKDAEVSARFDGFKPESKSEAPKPSRPANTN